MPGGFVGLVVGLGCWSLGALIGGVIAHYIAHVQEFTLRSLTSVVSILCGAGAIALFEKVGGGHEVAHWWYFVGLLVGATVIALFKRIRP